MIDWSKGKDFFVGHWKAFASFVVLFAGFIFLREREDNIKSVAQNAVTDAKTAANIEETATNTVIADTEAAVETFAKAEDKIAVDTETAQVVVVKKTKVVKQKLIDSEVAVPGTIAKNLADQFGAEYVETKTKD